VFRWQQCWSNGSPGPLSTSWVPGSISVGRVPGPIACGVSFQIEYIRPRSDLWARTGS